MRDDFQTAIQDKNFIYEMTANIELSNKASGHPILRKCPEALRPAFAITQTLSTETGRAIANWTNAGSPESEEVSEVYEMGEKAASCGIDKYKTWFESLDRTQQKYLVNSGKHEGFKAIASEFNPNE